MRVHSALETSGPDGGSVELLRELAARGRLADIMAGPAAPGEIRGAAYELVWPLVWTRHTRRLEHSKGHSWCASSLVKLESACLDGFHDDVEAVVEYLFRHAKGPIHAMEGWLVSRIPVAVVDGNRRRRGRRGALQRVRVPGWLAMELGGDVWLTELAGRVIEWVGVPSTAGQELWPVDAWAEARAEITGDHSRPRSVQVAEDLDTVLRAMQRCRPRWYAAYVERPLGSKQPPVVPVTEIDTMVDTARLEDSRLAVLAASAVEAISIGLAENRPPSEIVPHVIRAVFIERVCSELDDMSERGRWLSSVLENEDELSELVNRVLEVVLRADTRPTLVEVEGVLPG